MSDPVKHSKLILERFSLRERTALVTGGDQGISRAYAHVPGEAGASVAVVYVSSEAGDSMTGMDMIIDGGYCVW